jgi:predicted TIM-barrel fold metal-dependent hydrolase
MLANRVAMGRGLQAPLFRWVSYVDALIFPLNNEALKTVNPDYRAFYSSEEQVLKHYLDGLELNALPPTLDKYSTKVVTPTLERQKLGGAVAVKFEAAYLRTLDFSDASEVQAKRIYAHYVKGIEPPANEYKILQDYLFRYIAHEAGRLGLAVHIHTGLGIGGFFSVDGSHPLLLEPLFNDPTLQTTNFVLLHGGWPFAKQSAAMLLKQNVYADFSSLGFLIYPRELSDVIRSWLEIAPEKVMFGTDAIEVGFKTVGWEELGWIGTNSARQALAFALTGMVNDGEIKREKAVEFARMVLRGNAIKLYNLPQ